MSYLFETAGRQKKLTEAGLWFATAPEEELRDIMAADPAIALDWDPVCSDRMVKLVFIGRTWTATPYARHSHPARHRSTNPLL